jgi:DNA modification methylase
MNCSSIWGRGMRDIPAIEGLTWCVLVCDVLDGLRSLPDESVHCVCTSPPYWNLRDYQTGTWEGGDAECDHLGAPFRTKSKLNENWGAGFSDRKNAEGREPMGQTCKKCGARRIDRQIGLEKTPDEFVAKMVEVFREVRRVLRSNGVCWLNLGDSYASNWPCSRRNLIGNESLPNGKREARPARISDGLKEKDLCGIPWRVALALQADGWWLRDIICWSKKSPMPESVSDRCTKAWEPIFMLTKSARYFCDMEAVKEDAQYGYSTEIGAKIWNRSGIPSEVLNRPDGSTTIPGSGGSRNLRNVWHLGPSPFPDAHFATFPPEIPRRCILMGTSEKGCCYTCGAPWVRVTDRKKLRRERPNELTKRTGEDGTGNHCANTVAGVSVATKGWEPSCRCVGEIVPCTVLDPFSGSGTTGMVATELGRRYVGIELNPKYAEMSRKRIESWKYRDVEKSPEPLPGQKPLFAEADHA